MPFLLSFVFLFLLSGCQALNPFVSSSLDRDGDGVALGEDCDDTDPEIGIFTWYVDDDRDGFGTTGGITQCEALDGYADRAGDCDDTDNMIHPDATEICDNIDNNCDEVIDEDATDRGTWYADVDEDTYGDPDAPLVACEQPDGSVTDNTDCDDTKATTNPGALEVCEDETDNDCDGVTDTDAEYVTWYRDFDEDTYGDPLSTVTDCQQPVGYVADDTDCDDAEATTHPSAEEICNDWIDNNCDEEANECLWTDNQELSDRITISGIQNNNRTGSASLFFDMNQDGLDDLVVGSPGYNHEQDGTGVVSVFLSPVESSDLSRANFSFFGITPEENAGSTLLGGEDITGDGLPDLLVGSPTADAGSVYLIEEMVLGESFLPEISMQITGETNGDRAGSALSFAGDVNEDGNVDMFVGAYLAGGDQTISGAVYLVTGPVTEDTTSLADAFKLSGEETSDRAGYAIASGEDVSGDGIPDVLIGAFLASNDAVSQTGKIYLVHGPISSNLSLSDADGILAGEAASARLGSSIAIIPDYNEDGVADVLLGAYYESSAFTQAGAAYVVTSFGEGVTTITDYEIKLTGSSVEELAGWSVGWQEDMGDDGQDDLLIGAYKADTSAATQSGTLYLLEEYPGEGVFDLASTCLSFFGGATDDQAGYTFAPNGNYDGDGYVDLLVGSPGYGDVGAVYLVSGTGL